MYPPTYVRPYNTSGRYNRNRTYGPYRRKRNYYRPYTIQRQINYITSTIKPELKNHQKNSSGNMTWNGSIISLSDMPQDITENARIGISVLPRYLNLRLYCTIPAAKTAVRYIIFRWWGEQTGSGLPLPVPSEVIQDLGSVQAPMGHLVEQITGSRGDRARRIEVLRSEIFVLNNAQDSVVKDINIKMNGPLVKKKEKIEWNPSAIGPTFYPTSGGIWLLLVDQTAANGTAWVLDSKLSYYDS